MDPTENNSVPDDNNSEEQQGQSEGAESSVRPSLSQVKKSWGFRRTTIARREFLDEVGDLTHSPPHVRRGRNRRTNQTPQPAPETCATQGATRTTKSVIDDLEWSAPSSPVSEESKPASETSAGGSLDPSLWQDFGSAFHTAFSLLGGSEGLSMDMSDALAAPDMLQATGGIEASPAQAIDEPEVPENMEPADDMEISQPVASNSAVDDVVLISSQEEDSDNMTLIQIKEQLASKGKQAARGGKGGRGKARGRGRGRGKARGKGRGRGRGRGRAVELQSTIADDEDSDDEVMLVNPAEPQLQEEEKLNDSPSPAEIETSPAHSDISLSPAQPSNSDCIIIDSDLDQITYATPGQYDDAPEEEEEEGEEKKDEEKKDDKNEAENSGILDTEGYNSNALYCICRQKHNERFMICCDSCQDWFHGNCVGISQTQGRQMERKGQEYICPRCTAKKQSQLQSEPEPEPEPELEPELSFPECLTLSPPGEEGEGREEEQALKETVVVVEEEEAALTRPEPEPEAEMETVSSLPLCIGPRCSKQALPDSVYCGTECILQHAAVTMKTLSGPKVPKSKGRMQRKAATARPTTKGQRSGRMSKRLAGKAEEEGEEEEMKEDDGGQKEASSPLACDPRLTEVQATSIPSSQFYTASKEDGKQAEAGNETVTPSKQSTEDTSADAAPSVQPITEPERPQSLSQEKTKKPVDSGVSKQQSVESEPSVPLNQAKCSLSPTAQSPSTSAPRHHETGALMVTKTSYVIPKKQSGPQTQSSKVSVAASSQKPSSAPSLLNETRNLPVPPAPSAPSSRPSQPNNQVRQSIQRSLTSILFKRVCDCEDLKMSEIEVTKLVVSIEMEMFDIFRNTDSKYMNKYRTIMFNLKDPKNKGLLYRVIGGEISPFRLARMSQKDMQAIKASEPSPKETTEVKDAADKANLLQKPEAVKVDLPSLNPVRRDRNMEQKKSLPASTLKTRTSQPSQGGAVPDVLACMLKDTTSEHKAHLFDLKCKICTGQILAGDEEPAKKKPKVSETREKYEPSWRKSAGDDSPLRAPPDSPDMDSPTSRLIIDSPVLTIVESPASPTTDSPASPTLESPASPVMQSPASPIPDAPKSSVSKRAYTPVVIPAVSTVSITRRDPRTAASRFSASSTSTSGPSNTTHNQSAPYAPLKETRSASPPAPTSTLPTKSLPKSILMKPSSSADPRLYGTSSRTVISESPADGETAQFIAKQDILWKGFLNMLSVAKFVTKGYLVSGSAENLKADLPDTIQIGGRIMPETVWDYVAKLKTSVTKELCVIRFHPATEEEEVAYVSLFSYFSSRGRFGVVANSSRSIKDVYLVPLSAKEPVPSILQPLEGPGLEKNRPNLLLGLAIIQKAKRPGNLPLEIEEKRPKVHMAKDPMWIPKPPVLYGSDKLEIFQPYDPETPASTTPPGSPSCPGSPSESSSSGSVTVPSLLTSIRADPPVSTSASVPVNQSTSISISDKNPTTASSDKTPLQTILKTLFSNKQTDSADGSTTATTGSDKKLPVFSQVSGSMVDPIVQQYGQKSKVKEIEEEENDFDRPYDPEEEYDPAVGYGMVASQSMEKNKADGNVISGFVDDDVAYDPEDESIFEDIQSDIVTKPRVPTQTSDSPSCPTPSTTQAVTPAPSSTPVQTSTSAEVTQAIPTGTVVVSAATLTEQQRMLEELNKQIEEQKRQLKEQEEALRQQREAVGMFMAHFSVSDTLMSPPSKSLPLSQLSSLPSGIMQTESKPSESMDKTSSLQPTENVAHSNVDSQTVKPEDTTVLPNVKNDRDTVSEQDETQENVKESDKYSSAGEIEDSDVAYDPEDESLFNEIQDDVFQGSSIKTCDSSWSRTGHSACHKGTQNSHHNRKRRLSPKRRSHRERDRHRSPSRKSQRRSPSHSQRRRERDRHRKSERDRSRHRTRDQSERQGRHRKEHSTRRHSRGRRRSSLSPRKNDSVSLSPKPNRGPSPQDPEKSSTSDTIKNDPDGHQCNLVESPDKDFSSCSHELLQNVKLEILEHPNSISDDNTSGGCSTQVDKSSLQETLLTDKLDSTIPLREIDPPIRDSPQSPDPEPQFAKPSSTEKSDFKSEEIRNPETYTSISMPPVKVENNTVHQATMPNILWPGGPISDVRNLDFRALGQHGLSVRDQCVIEADKQIEGEGPGLRHPEILGQGGGHYSPAAGSVTKCPGPGVSGPGIRNSGPNMKQSGNSGPQIYPRGSGIRFPGPDIRGPSPNIWVPGPHTQDLTVSGQGKHGRDPGTGMQGEEALMREPGIQHHNSDIIGSGPDIRGSRMRSPVQDMESPRMQGMNPQVKGPCPDMRDSNPEIREQMLVPAVRESLMRGSALQNERRDEVMKGPLSDRLGSDLCPDIRSTGPSFSGSGRVQRQSRHNDSPVLDEGGPWKRGFQPHGRDSDLSRVGDGRERSFDSNASTGSEGIVLRADRLSPAMTDDRRGPQRERDVPMRRRGPNIIYESDGPREHLKEPQPDIRDETVMGPKQMDPEDRGPMPNIINPDWRSPGPGLVGPDMRGQRSQNKGRGRHMRDPNWSGPGLDIGDGWRGPDRGASGPLRGGPVIQDEWRVHQPDRRGQNMESQGPDRRGIGDQNFRGTGPEIKSPNTEHLRHEKRGPGGPDFMGPGYERGGSEMEVLMHDRRGPGGPDFRRPEPENRGPTNDNLESGMRGPVAPDLMGPGLDRRGLPIEDPVPTRRGPAGPEFRGPWSERRDPGMGCPGTDRQGPGTDFSEPGSERRGLSMEGPGPPRGGPGGPDFRGPGRERRGPAMEGPGIDRRGPGGPDFRGPGAESRGPAMESPGTDRRGPGGPDFRGPGPERRGPAMGGPGPDRRGPGGPDFRGPGPESRGLSMEGPGPDRRGPGGPDFRGPGPERRGPAMEGPGTDRRGPGGPDFRGPVPEWRHPPMDAPGPDRRGSGGPDFSMPGPDRRGPAIDDLGPDRRESGVTDFSGLGNDRRGHNMDSQESDRRGPGCLDFQGPGSGRRGSGGLDTRAPGCERRGPFMQNQGPDRRGPGDQNTGGFGPDSRAPYTRGPGPDFIGVGPERTGPGMDYSGPHDRGQGGPHFRGPGPRSGHPDMEGAWPDKGGPEIRPRPERPGSCMEGPGPNRGPGGPNMRRPGPQHSSQNIEGPGLDRRGPEGPNFRGPGPERRLPDMDETGNSKSFPGGPYFSGPEPERRPPDMEHPGSDRRGPHLRGMRPERSVIEGPGSDRKGLRGPDFRGSVFEGRGPQIEGPGLDRQEPGGLRFREPVPERRGPDMEGPQSDWRRSGGPDFRGPGIRQKGPNTEVPRNRGDDWGGADFGGLGPIQERPDIEGPGPNRSGQNMRGLGPMRRNVSGPGPNMNQGEEWKGPDFRGSEHVRRDTEEQWSDGRGPYMEPVRNERECLEDGWEIHGNRGPGPISEGPDKQAQEHSRQGSHMGRRGRGSRGSRHMQERPHMPLRGPGDDWGGPGGRGPGPVQDDPDMVYPGPDRGEPGNEWREPDTGSGGPNIWGSGQFFRGERDQDNRGQGQDRRGPGIRGLGSDRRRGGNMGNDWRQPEFRDKMRGPNMDGLGSHREDSDLINSYPNRRGFEMEGLHRRGPGSENRNSNIEGTDRFPDCGGLGTERRGANMESPGTGRQGFEQDYRRERRGPDMRRPGPGKTDMRGPAPQNPDIRYGPGRWDTNTEGPVLDLGGSDPASFHFNSHQVTRFQGPSDSHSAHHIGPLGPAQNSGENSCPGFDNLQNRQALKPQRHRTALLPTPTEGLIRFPNCVINNPDVFSPKRKQIGHQKDREWSRCRSVSRERELVKGQRQEQEKSPAGKLRTPVDTGAGHRQEKKEEGNENEKEGNPGACLETKTNQNVDSDANKSSVKPS